MPGSATHRRAAPAVRFCSVVCCGLAALFVSPAFAQTQAQPKSTQAAPPSPAQMAPETAPAPGSAAPVPEAPPASRPGLIEALGDLIKDSAQSTQKSIENLNEANRNNLKAATDAVQGLPKLPGSRVATGRVICVAAANGAPDCKTGADKLCHDKGFGDGNSLATETAKTCSPRALLSGGAPKAGDCRTDTFVTQAICQ